MSIQAIIISQFSLGRDALHYSVEKLFNHMQAQIRLLFIFNLPPVGGIV